MPRRRHRAIAPEIVEKIFRRLHQGRVLSLLALEFHGIDTTNKKTHGAPIPQSAVMMSSAFAWACLEYLRSGCSGDTVRANAKALEAAIKVLEADNGEALATYMTGAAQGVTGMALAGHAVWSMRELAKSLHCQARRIEAASAGASFGALLARHCRGQKVSVRIARKVYTEMIKAAFAEGISLAALGDDGALRRALARGAKVKF